MKPTSLSSTERIVVACAGAVVGFASLVLAGGWFLNIEKLRAPSQLWSAMAPFTAVMLILLGLGIIWFERRRTTSVILLAIAAAIAAATLAEHLLGVSVGIQTATTALGKLHRLGQPELPDPDTCLGVLMLVLALACARTRARDLHDFADVLATVVGIVCMQVLVAYAYNIANTSGFRGFRQIAPHSTLSLILLAFALTARRPTPGLFAAMTGGAQSASLLRRLLPVTMVLCLIIGWLHVLAVRERVASSMPELVAWTVTATVVVLALLLFVTSAELRKAETTVQHRQEELISARIAAEAASEAKSRFMAVMSHELRTPLTAVIGYTDLLGDGVAGKLTDDTRGYLQRIRASGWHLAGLIDAVLLYAGEKMPADDTRIVRLDVGELVRDVVGMFETQARDKGLALELDAASSAIFVNTHERMLRQILINLLSNAIKFTERGRIRVQVRAHEQHAVIDVTDSGIGIEAEHLARLWEPFHMADASHTRTRSGMGLGLALTHQLAEQLGARVAVQSTPGDGTTFTLELPRAEAAETARVQLTGVRILVVDDETAVLRIMARTLARYGGEITQAESAPQALAAVAGNAFDVVVTDISMPGMTGIELASTLKAQQYPAPILFVTGAELNADEHAAIRALGGHLLKKPFDMVELGRRVQQLAATS